MIPSGHKLISYAYALGKQAIFFMVAVAVIHLFILTIFIIDGISMVKTLDDGQIVLVERIRYAFSQPRRGDVVVLHYPGDPENRTFVKRIIGLPGESIIVKGGRVFINHQELLEPYLGPDIETDRDREVTLGSQEYYVLGDNRPVSNDSRVFGPVEKRFLVGRVIAITIPINQAKIIPKVFYE